MDIENLNSRAAQSEGAFLHLRHPATGEMLYDGEPIDENAVGLYVRGVEHPKAQSIARKNQDRKFKNEREQNDAGREYIGALIAGFVRITTDGRSLDAESDADIKLFCDMSDDFVHQVLDFAGERTNFWKAGSGASKT